MSNSVRPHRRQPTRLLCPRDSPGKNTRVGCHFLIQGIFLTQELNLCLLHWQVSSLPLSQQGSLYFSTHRPSPPFLLTKKLQLHPGPFPLHGSHVYWVDTTFCQCCNVSTLLRDVTCGFRKSNCYLPQSKSSIIWTAHTSNLYTFLVYWLFPVCFKYYIGLSDI